MQQVKRIRGVAPISQVTHVRTKIVTLNGGHLMRQK